MILGVTNGTRTVAMGTSYSWAKTQQPSASPLGHCLDQGSSLWVMDLLGPSMAKLISRWKVSWDFESKLVGGIPTLWKIWMSVGMIIPNTWINKKCSKPPTSKGIMFGQQQQEKIRRRIRRRKEELRTKTKTITTTHQKISILWWCNHK